MSMPLLQEIGLQELKDEPERFDFLAEAVDGVIKLVEMHPDDQNDAVYVYMVWTSPEASEEVYNRIKINVMSDEVREGWDYTVTHVHDGMVMVHTWINN